MEIRALREEDDRSQFRSGDPDLDRFLHKFAGQNQFKHYLGVTYVAVDDGRILGFATVAPGHVEIDGLPAATRKKLPRYPLPILRLARLAVDQAAQGQGLGRRLLRFVFELALQMASDYGCIGVAVECPSSAHPNVPRHTLHPGSAGREGWLNAYAGGAGDAARAGFASGAARLTTPPRSAACSA
jgi:GNAT superfamily N-acetyltransferase